MLQGVAPAHEAAIAKGISCRLMAASCRNCRGNRYRFFPTAPCTVEALIIEPPLPPTAPVARPFPERRRCVIDAIQPARCDPDLQGRKRKPCQRKTRPAGAGLSSSSVPVALLDQAPQWRIWTRNPYAQNSEHEYFPTPPALQAVAVRYICATERDFSRRSAALPTICSGVAPRPIDRERSMALVLGER